jgi:ribosome-interacting GTPase 1
MKPHTIIFALLTLLFCACNSDDEIPSTVLKPDKMQAVMWDIVRADVFTSEFIKADSTKDLLQENLQLQKKIFALNKITKEQYYTSFEYYKSKPELMRVMLDTMIARVNRGRNKAASPIPNQSIIQ